MKLLLTYLFVGLHLLTYSQSLIWSDEFDSTALDRTKWNYHTGTGYEHGLWRWGNEELQYYSSRDTNVKVENGLLKITALADSAVLQGIPREYTSGKIVTDNLRFFTYGTQIVARMKLTSAKCAWPAFWMLGENNKWPSTGEIDIFEAKHTDPRDWGATLHYEFDGNHESSGIHENPGTSLSTEFHEYGIIWDYNSIKFTYDSVVVGQVSAYSTVGGAWPFNNKFYLILNVAVGGPLTGYTGYLTPLPKYYPTTLEVDYVRVYALPEYDHIVLDVPGKIEMEDFSYMGGIETEDCLDTNGGLNIGYLDGNDFAIYYANADTTGYYKVSYRLAANTNQGQTFELRTPTNSLNEITVPITNDWQAWESVVDTIHLTQGEQKLEFVVTNAGQFNANWMDFELLSAGPDTIDYNKISNIEKIMVSLSPNPAINNIRLAINDELDNFTELEILDITGKSMIRTQIKNKISDIDISKLNSGIYFFNIVTKTAKTTKKIIVH